MKQKRRKGSFSKKEQNYYNINTVNYVHLES